MGERSWQTAFPRFPDWHDLCSALPSSSFPNASCLWLPKVSLGWTAGCWLCPGPSAGIWGKAKKKRGGTGRCWRHQRARANTSWSQVWVGNEELTGQRAGFLLPVSVKRRVFFPPNRWALESCNKVYHSVWHRPLPSQRSVLTDCNQDIH